MTDPTIEVLRGWISTGALVGLLTLAARLWIQNRRLSMQSKVEDRQGYGSLIESMSKRIESQDERIAGLERGRDKDHRLIVALVGQLNRNQALAIITSADVSDELRPALESVLGQQKELKT